LAITHHHNPSQISSQQSYLCLQANNIAVWAHRAFKPRLKWLFAATGQNKDVFIANQAEL